MAAISSAYRDDDSSRAADNFEFKQSNNIQHL
jgi:hypothetical protein